MSLTSMTGFGNTRIEQDGLSLNISIKAVNHRFLDIAFRLPAVYAPWEQDIARAIAGTVKRGHLDVTINRMSQRESDVKLSLNEPLLTNYLEMVKKASAVAGIDVQSIMASAVLSLIQKREIVEGLASEQSLAGEKELIFNALAIALQDLQKMKAQEGEKLSAVLLEMIGQLKNMAAEIATHTAEVVVAYQVKLKQRLERLAADLEFDEQRVAQEIALFADRVDITEELDRLNGHIQQFNNFIAANEGGKKIDFLIQEMGREINTIGSKAQSRTISALVIESKATLEKIREQVQNVE
ncbi:MAG: YicC family protein [Deltaproteobacteria bacterium]|nr:YicC family protein [Deltaproteobacteria bacterium]